ncbi:MAG: PAS domain S-box protein [Thermoleophilia bacterium]
MTAGHELPDGQELLDGLTALVAILDADGLIVAANAAWRDTARLAGVVEPLGQTYLDLCASVPGCGMEPACAAIGAVLAGREPRRQLVYRCVIGDHSIWFRATVTARAGGGAIVEHVDVTNDLLTGDALADREQRLRLALESAEMGVWVMDVVEETVEWSPEVHAILGVDDFDGRVETFRGLVLPDDLDASMAVFERALAGTEPFAVEFRIRRPDGEVRWISNLGQLRPGPDGAARFLVGTVQDVTERRRGEEARERQVAGLQLLSEVLAGLIDERDGARLAADVFERVSAFLGCDVFTYLRASPEGLRLVDAAGLDPAIRAGMERGELLDTPCALVAATREPVYLPHAQRGDTALALTACALGVRAYAGFPLLRDGELAGVLGYASTTRDELGVHELEFLRTLAQAVATTLARLHDAEQLRVSERRFRAAIETSPDGFVELGPGGRVVDVNDVYLRRSGFARDELVGMRLAELDGTFDQDGLDHLHEQKLERGGLTFQTTHRARDGTTWPVEISSALTAEGGCYSFLRDITERLRSEHDLRLQAKVLDSMNETVVLDADDGEIVYVNPACDELFGYEAGELLGRHISVLHDPGTEWEAFGREVMAEVAARGFWRGDVLSRRKHGEAFTAAVTIMALDLGDGRPYRVSIGQDVTEQRRADALLSSILAAVPSAVITIDEPGQVVSANPAAELLLGRPAADLVGRSIADLLGLPTAGWRAGVEAAGGLSLERPDGTVAETEATLAEFSLLDEGHVVLVLRDVTERARLEEQVRQTQKLDAIGQLAGGVAHDLNNVLGAILGYAELGLTSPDAGPDALASFEGVLRVGERARRLIEQILAFGRQQPAERRVVPLGPLVEESARMLRATLPASVVLATSVADDVPLASVDPTQVHQVVVNLGTNAWHALEGRPGRIELTLARVDVDVDAAPEPALHEGTYACLTVRDDGVGMDAATLDRVFEPFFTTKPPGKGTGLGLSVVHGIVRGHDGAIVATSSPGSGSAFAVYFPAAIAPAGREPELPAASGRGDGARVLYVDDEEHLLGTTARMLERLGYHVTALASPREALAAVAADPDAFDVVVADYTMPELSGLQVAEAVLAQRSDLPVVLVSGYFTAEVVAAAERLGVRRCVPKPTTPSDLGGVLAAILHPVAPGGRAGG